MDIEIGHYPEEDRLDLTIEGSLDLRLTGEFLRVCSLIDRRVRLCVIDSTRVEQVFDSGIGLLMLLINELRAAGVELIMIGEIPGLPASVTAAEWPLEPGVGAGAAGPQGRLSLR